MRIKPTGVFFWILLAWLVIQLSGCTFIGYGLGKSSDSGTPPRSTIFDWKDLRLLRPGKAVSVLFKDGHSEQGSFLGIRQVPEAAYARQYEAFREQNRGVRLPALSEKLAILTTDGRRRDGVFSGFDWSGLAEPSFCLRMNGLVDAVPIPAVLIQEVLFDTENLPDLEKIKGLLLAGKIPFVSMIGFDAKTPAGSSAKLISWHEIRNIEVTKKSRGWLTGLIIGGAIDALTVIAIIGFSSGNWLHIKIELPPRP